MDHGQFIRSNVVYQRGRGTEDGRESFPSRKPCFRIIYAMMKMFPPWPGVAASTSGHLDSNQKRRNALRAVMIRVVLIKLLRKVQTGLFYPSGQFQKSYFDVFKRWLMETLACVKPSNGVNFLLKISEKTSGQNFTKVSDFLNFHWKTNHFATFFSFLFHIFVLKIHRRLQPSNDNNLYSMTLTGNRCIY